MGNDVSYTKKILVLVDSYWKYDRNRNGKLERDEVSVDIKDLDQDGDNAVSPWEMMEGINRQSKVQIFTPGQIAAMRKLNQSGKAFDDVTPEEDSEVQGILYRKGQMVRFNNNGLVMFGMLAKDTPLNVGKNKVTFLAGTNPYFDSDGSVSDGILAGAQNIQNIKFDSGTRLNFHNNGAIWMAHHLKDINVNGIIFKGGMTYFNYNGTIRHGTLTEDANLQAGGTKVKFKGGSEIDCHDTGSVRIGTLAEDSLLQTPKGKMKFKDGTYVEFSGDGRVRSGILAKDAVIDGINCWAGTEIEFDGSGRLASLFLHRDTEIKGIRYKPTIASVAEVRVFCNDGWSRAMRSCGHLSVSFNAKGDVICGTLAEDRTFKIGGRKILFRAGTHIDFSENGQIERVGLDKPAIMDLFLHKEKIKIAVPVWLEDFSLDFYKNGIIKSIKLAENTKIQGYLFKAKDHLEFHENGNVASGVLAESRIISGISFKEGSIIEFDKDKKIYEAIPSNDITIKEVKFGNKVIGDVSLKAGNKLTFSENGQIDYSVLAADKTIEYEKQALTFKVGGMVAFFDDAILAGGELKSDTAIKLSREVITFKANTWLLFYSGGTKISQGTLARTAVIDGKTYVAGTTVWLSPSGQVIKAKKGME